MEKLKRVYYKLIVHYADEYDVTDEYSIYSIFPLDGFLDEEEEIQNPLYMEDLIDELKIDFVENHYEEFDYVDPEIYADDIEWFKDNLFEEIFIDCEEIPADEYKKYQFINY